MIALGRSLIAVALVAGAADWVVVARGAKRAEYALKPLTLALMVAAAVALRSNAPSARWWLTLAALILSLAGDVLLMLPVDLFVAGLASFLLAHAAYVTAFNLTPPPAALTVVAAVAVLAAGGGLFARIRAGMVRQGAAEMAVPVAIYVLAISAMVVSAIATAGRPGWDAAHSALAIAGALLFMASDALIGWTRFVQELRWAPVTIIVTYHIAQAALVLALLS